MKKLILLSIGVLITLYAVGCNILGQEAELTPEPTAAQTAEPDGKLTEAQTAGPVAETTANPTAASTDMPEATEQELIEAAWAVAEKLEQVHELEFDKAGADVRLSAYLATVSFPCVTYPDEVLCMTLEKDAEGDYSVSAESVYFELAEGGSDELAARFDSDTIIEKLEEFQSAEIAVTVDEIRASGCEAEIGADEYKVAAAAVYGEKLAEYYRGSLTEDSPFCCYDIRFVGIEAAAEHADSYNVLIGFRVRDILPFSYLFGYGPIYDNGTLHPGYEGWLVGWTLVKVVLEDNGSFLCNAVLNGAG